jgi:type II secretory pathway component PulF
MMEFNEFKFLWKRKAAFKVKGQLEFMRQFNSYMEDGKTGIKDALELTQEAYCDIYGEGHVVNEICERILIAIEEGRDYDAMMREYFHPNLAVGYELSKRVSTNKRSLRKITDLVEVELKLIDEVVKQLLQPFVIFLAGIGIMMAVGGFIVPNLERQSKTILTGNEAMIAKGLFWFGTNMWPVIAVLIVALMVGTRYLQDNWTEDSKGGRFRPVFDSIWPFSVYRVFWSIRLMRLIGLLKQAGVGDKESFQIISRFGSPYINYHIDLMLGALMVGKRRKEYFLKGLLSKSQAVRLGRYFRNTQDDEFAVGLLDVSEQAEIDVALEFRRASKRFELFFLLSGLFLMAMGVGAVLDGGVAVAG